MKNVTFLVFILFIGCSTFAQNSINYIQINNYNSPNYNLVELDDFLGLLDEHGIQTVFYTDRQFIIQAQNIAYTINSNGYKNLADYKDGKDREFKDGNNYYYAKELNLPNQTEVDYFNSEPYLTIEDYHDAVRLGIPHNENILQSVRNFYGLISAEDLQKNIRYASSAIYLSGYLQYANVEALKNYGMTDQQIITQNISRQSTSYSWGYGRTEDGTNLLNNESIDVLVQRGGIRKLDNFNYYLVDIGLSDSEASFYYAFKSSSYSNMTELNNNIVTENRERRLLTKENASILSSLGFNTIAELLDADRIAVTNSRDYYLVVEYGLSKERLDENRELINNLETIKARYLSAYSSNQRTSGGYNSNRASTKSQYAFIIYNMLRLEQGQPTTVDVLIQNIQREYSRIYSIFQIDNSIVNSMFRDIPQLSDTIMYNNGTFYLK